MSAPRFTVPDSHKSFAAVIPAPAGNGWLGAYGTPIDADPTKEYVTSGGVPAFGDIRQTLSRNIDSITQAHGGDAVYGLMMMDPAVSAAVNTLKHGVLSERVQLIPNILPPPGQKDFADDPEMNSKLAISRAVMEFDRRCLDRLEEPIEDVSWSVLDGLVYGCELAEIVYDEVKRGEDRGKWMLRRVDPKPRSSWQFVVDAYMKPVGILGTSSIVGNSIILPLAKFMILNWRPRRGDPRGTSILEPAFNPWNLKVQCWPELLNYIVRFGTPSLVGETAPNAKPRPQRNADGTPIQGVRDLTAEEALAQDLAAFANARAIGVASGTKVNPIEVKGNGEAHRTAIDLFNREITLAVLTQIRATIEAKFGSKADSETGADILNLIVKGIKWLLARVIRDQLLYRVNVLNFGVEIAEAHTPKVMLGDVLPKDQATMLRAYSTVGYLLDTNQFPAIDQSLGLHVRDASSINPVSPPIRRDNPPADDSPVPNLAATVLLDSIRFAMMRARAA